MTICFPAACHPPLPFLLSDPSGWNYQNIGSSNSCVSAAGVEAAKTLATGIIVYVVGAQWARSCAAAAAMTRARRARPARPSQRHCHRRSPRRRSAHCPHHPHLLLRLRHLRRQPQRHLRRQPQAAGRRHAAGQHRDSAAPRPAAAAQQHAQGLSFAGAPATGFYFLVAAWILGVLCSFLSLDCRPGPCFDYIGWTTTASWPLYAVLE